MKNIITLFLITTMLSCCSRDNDRPKTELEKLPPATQIGANTAGCLVNGIAFLPKGYVVPGNLICNYNDGENFTLGITERILHGATDNIRSILVISYNQNLHDNVGTIFPLKEYGANSKSGEYIINAVASPDPNYYSTTPTVMGELKITYHNYNPPIISGTFWFDAINSNGEKVEVRSGRFDMHY